MLYRHYFTSRPVRICQQRMSPLSPKAEQENHIGSEPVHKMQKVTMSAAQLGKAAAAGQALLIKRLSEHAVLPKRGSNGAAGYDLAR